MRHGVVNSGTWDWGIGTGTIPQSPIPNPQSPIPNPQSPIPNPQSPIPNPQSPIPNPQSPIPNPKSRKTKSRPKGRLFV
ncbi:hypothetical protein C7I36_05320 [Zobellella taiwanensis]|uniref:Uncharacterized protein n=1 Tax=Zobellella taiwanensis TaxID=347535 RepID=A0A2P7R5Q3_9GAMM|nr:hypothetical protein C7I36_05320 [Zobellella taiwanensis]